MYVCVWVCMWAWVWLCVCACSQRLREERVKLSKANQRVPKGTGEPGARTSSELVTGKSSFWAHRSTTVIHLQRWAALYTYVVTSPLCLGTTGPNHPWHIDHSSGRSQVSLEKVLVTTGSSSTEELLLLPPPKCASRHLTEGPGAWGVRSAPAPPCLDLPSPSPKPIDHLTLCLSSALGDHCCSLWVSF